MRIAASGGHSKAAPGASGFIDEYTEDRAVTRELVNVLTARGHVVSDCSNEAATQSQELITKVNKANEFDAELFMDVHFNAATTTDAARGVEVYHFPGSTKGEEYARRVSASLARALGLPNRGAKPSNSLYVLRRSAMPAILIEVCFVDSRADVDAYHTLTARGVAVAIDTAITGEGSYYAPEPAPEPAPTVRDSKIAILQNECNAQGFSSQVVDGIAGANTLNGCPTLRPGARGNITAWVQQRLIERGYSLPKYGADGVYGDETVDAVKAFQRDNGLAVDGVTGRNTWRALLGL